VLARVHTDPRVGRLRTVRFEGIERLGEYKSRGDAPGPAGSASRLSPLSRDERFAIPDQGTSANALRSASGGSSSLQSVAVRGTKARLMRDGAQRWLAVDLPPEKAYQVVKDFWPSVGPETGARSAGAGHRGDGIGRKSAPRFPPA